MAAPQQNGTPAAATMYLHPGHTFIAAEATLVTTILGSCVAACVWDAQSGIGGLTHYLLPRPVTGNAARARFGTTAIADLVDALVLRGARRGMLQAKLFGGSAMNATLATAGTDIGSNNVRVAVEALQELSIPVVARDTEGSVGRKLLFHTIDGRAWIKYLGGS